jgi:hypothetical protein
MPELEVIAHPFFRSDYPYYYYYMLLLNKILEQVLVLEPHLTGS